MEHARRFRDAVADDRLSALYTVALTTGLRRGEAMGLAWEDIDFKRGTLAIRHTLIKVADGWERAEPKTAGSRRIVRLPEIAITELRRHRVRQLEERLQAGSEWQDTGLVFTTTLGTAIDGSNLLRAFRSHLRRVDLPPIRFHDLRHSAATFMLTLGVQPKVVAEMLGHSNVGTTLDTYSLMCCHIFKTRLQRRWTGCSPEPRTHVSEARCCQNCCQIALRGAAWTAALPLQIRIAGRGDWI